MLDSEPLSDFISRRSDLIMVIPYLMAATTKWDCSKASAMGLKTIYAALFILVRE
jgi:hypothetical protein